MEQFLMYCCFPFVALVLIGGTINYLREKAAWKKVAKTAKEVANKAARLPR